VFHVQSVSASVQMYTGNHWDQSEEMDTYYKPAEVDNLLEFQLSLLTSGEHWDQSEEMDTYYNPVPHFTYQMALDHSPTLKNVRRFEYHPQTCAALAQYYYISRRVRRLF